VDEFKAFLENKLDIKTDEHSDSETTIIEEGKEEKKFHFLKFEIILREFYQKNEIRHNLINNYKTNDEKKVDLGFSYVKHPIMPKTYEGKKYVHSSPVIKKNFYEDHKDEIKMLKRRKTMFSDHNMLDKLKSDLVEKKLANSQIPKFNFNQLEEKEDKVSLFSFSENVEEKKDNKDNEHKNSLKISKRTSIFDAKLSYIVDEEDEEKLSEDSQE